MQHDTNAQSPTSFGLVGNDLGSMVSMDPDMITSQTVQASSTSTQTFSQILDSSQEIHGIPNISYQDGSFNSTYDPPMAFRDRHRCLDAVYSSYRDLDGISARTLEGISRRVGLSMEEILSWFEDEKARRARLLLGNFSSPPESRVAFPLSPADTTTPAQNSTITLDVSQGIPSPQAKWMRINDIFSPPPPPVPSTPVPAKVKRGRPAKIQSLNVSEKSSSPETKRQKRSINYPCPDCKNVYTIERWTEHIKRVHFPDQVWECPKVNPRTKEPCGFGPSYRADNFATHLRGEHACTDAEISHLKGVSSFKVVDFFHHTCGFCGELLATKDGSIDHIKEHFREISLRSTIPSDLGVSEWKEQCSSKHVLIRGTHYALNEDADAEMDAPDDYNDSGDSGWPGQGRSEDSQNEESQNQNGSGHFSGGADGHANDTTFYYGQGSGFRHYGHFTSPNDSCQLELDTMIPKYSVFGLEGLTLPFTSVKKLGSGSHGSVDEVVCASSKGSFARKSVTRKHTELSISFRMVHLKNELSVLKELNHPNLVRLIGAYTDEDYSHIIMSPVADRNLADFMRTPDQNPEYRFLEWMVDLSSALAYLHERMVKHLDIKPQNILVKGAQVLLADFGAARSFFHETRRSQEVALTPMYCAPETARYGRQDYGADIFSLGCVFSEMITCHLGLPLWKFENFRSKNGNTIFYMNLLETYGWIQQLQEIVEARPTTNLPEQLFSEISSMLAEEVNRRPHAQELHTFFSGSDKRVTSCNMLDIMIPSSLNTMQLEPSLNSTTVPRKAVPASSPRIEFVSQLHETQDAPRHDIGFQAMDTINGLPLVTLSELPSPSSGASSAPEFPPEPDISGIDVNEVHPQHEIQFGDFQLYSSNTDMSEYSEHSSPKNSFGASRDKADFQNNSDHFSDNFVDPSILHPLRRYRNQDFLAVDGSYQSSPYSADFPYSSRQSHTSRFSSDTYHKHQDLIFNYENNLNLYQPPAYPGSPLTHPSRGLLPKQNSRSPYFSSYSNYPYPPLRRQVVGSCQTYSGDNFSSEELREKRRCTLPECGKVYKDLKAHMLTHQNERPEKCPVQTCEYHIKGFARKYDKNRHTLTHYKDSMVCGFCPISSSATERSFNRADVFKRHLTKVHAVEQTTLNSRRKGTPQSNELMKRLSGCTPNVTGQCSTCNLTFTSAQDFYEHLDDCVLQVVYKELTA